MVGDPLTHPRQAIHTRPNPLYETILTRKLRKLERDAKIGKNVRENMKGDTKQFTSTDLGRRLHIMADVHAPKLGVDILVKIVCIASAGTLANLGVNPSYLPALLQLTPSPATLNKLVIELGVDIMLLVSKEKKDMKLSLICDKVESKGLVV